MTQIKRIVSIQSHVSYGHVGNGAAAFALQRMGFEVIVVPTVWFSNHPGHPHFGGRATGVRELDELLGGLSQNRWFGPVQAVITGYLGCAAQADRIAEGIRELKSLNPELIYICDPVCGDTHTGLYVDSSIPAAMKAKLFPLADYATPNWFELHHFADQPEEAGSNPEHLAEALSIPNVVCTSVPFPGAAVGEVLVAPDLIARAHSKRLDPVPHGAGDLFTAIFTGCLVAGRDRERALQDAHHAVQSVLRKSRNAKEMRLIAAQQILDAARPQMAEPETAQQETAQQETAQPDPASDNS